jgi:hypothetical protein
MAVLQNGSKCSNTTCMLRFFTLSRLALNPNLIFEIGSNYFKINRSEKYRFTENFYRQDFFLILFF